MKKNVEIINIDPSLVKWIKKDLDNSTENIKTKDDLSISLGNLIDGISSTLMLEINENNNYNFDHLIKCGDLKIYINSRRVTRNDIDITLTPKEFDILYFLAKNRGDVFTKEQIYQAVWEDNYLLDDSNIMAFIRKLRKKIEPNPDAPIYILTIWGIGYKFNDHL